MTANRSTLPPGTTSCHTCNIFSNDQSIKSNLTGKEYKTITYDRLSCGSTSVIYGVHFVHYGFVYVGKTGRSLRSRKNGHRSLRSRKNGHRSRKNGHRSVTTCILQITFAK